jgi:hypothetical protein
MFSHNEIIKQFKIEYLVICLYNNEAMILLFGMYIYIYVYIWV